MNGSRIIENQRQAALTLIGRLGHALVPGRPFVADVRAELGSQRGYGSRDRRIYRELIFTWLRYRAWYDAARAVGPEAAANLLIALAPETPEILPLQAAIGVPGGISLDRGPEARARLERVVPGIAFDLRSLLPTWFHAHCPALFEESEILVQLTRPPFWLRAQRGSSADLVHELSRDAIAAVASTRIPGAVRVREYVELEEHPLVTGGHAEVQDIGSQALLAMAAPAPGGRWLDFCAGAGGKTLQLALAVGPEGRVTAHDIRRDALMETRRRTLRAGIRNIVIEPVLPEPGLAVFDGVLIDAPCSASGTWRRHPFLRHQTTLAVVTRYAGEQLKLLTHGADYVAPGGRLVYATCSLSRRENEEVVTRFLEKNQDFRLESPPLVPAGLQPAVAGWITLLPSALDSDGYFLACLRRKG
jgi:16S rRNA (cytosine967-C5)-methyltransferase